MQSTGPTPLKDAWQARGVDLGCVPSPCYLVDSASLRCNLEVIDHVQKQSGAKVLLALKGFAMWSVFDLVSQYLRGVTASSLNEALLGQHEFGGEVHAYLPAYRDDEFDQIVDLCDHISFNSMSQWQRFKSRVRDRKCAVRINPQHSESKTPFYDPCAPGSRLGVTFDSIKDQSIEGLSGLHFHTLCQLDSDALQRTLKVVEQKFGSLFSQLSWINFGGGHHISRRDYDVGRLISIISDFKQRYGLEVYLEPGEAIALNAGVLVATVLDVMHNEIDTAVLDTSATAHMPDVLEMPYRPDVVGAGLPGEKKYTYRLGGMSCLAGDAVGDYSFDSPLAVGDKVVFTDMAHYTMVKNTMFNGVNLPSIAVHDAATGRVRVVRRFGYDDYRGRLS